jgi:hypothetical protein
MTTHRLTDQDWRPNLFIAGFNKCGTTELCDYLSQHPDIFLSPFDERGAFSCLAKYPAYDSADIARNRGKPSISINDYYCELYPKGKKYIYRIDVCLYYTTFNPKSSAILKSFFENAKVILMICGEKYRLASMYLFLRQKKNYFLRWLHDYFIRYIRIYLYYYRLASACCYEFGDKNIRIVEVNNLSLQDIDKQSFEYLIVKPIIISIRHEKRNLLGPTDFKVYLQLRLTITSILLGTLIVAQQIGFEKQASWGIYM